METPDGKQELELLPCNPAKQAKSPSFIGYLTWRKGNLSAQFGINAKPGGGISMIQHPNTAALDPNLLKQGLELLLKVARDEGHMFPNV
jgi:hypothetical protein